MAKRRSKSIHSRYPNATRVGAFLILLFLMIVVAMEATGTTAKFFAVLGVQPQEREALPQITPEIKSGEFSLLTFPEPFIHAGNFDAILVVGKDAPAQDVVTAANLGAAMSSWAPGSKVPSAKLDSEIINKQGGNMILIGGDKVNRLIAELKVVPYMPVQGMYSSRQSGFEIKVYNKAFGGNYAALVIEGATPSDTTRAANILIDYPQSEKFMTTEIEFEGVTA